MSTLTLKQLVHNQLKAEAPGFETALQFDHYISRTLHEMTNSELLDRISDALDMYTANLSVRLGL